MTFIYKGWRVKSHENGGFIVQRTIGQQFKEASYFNSLAQAANHLLEQRIHYESVDIVIDATDKAKASIANARLIKLIKHVSEEILGGLDA